MDSFTHIALGACIGELVGGKSLGKKAMIVGSVAQSIPDLDFIASFWLSPANDLLAHRGFTHSFLFIVLVTYPLSLIAKKWRWFPSMPIKNWMVLIGLELFVHILLDAFNAYGTAWLEPFSQVRIAFHILFVADPLFTIPLIISTLFLLVSSIENKSRARWAWVSIIISVAYLGIATINKSSINTTVKRSLSSQQVSYSRYFSSPTPGNIWLWFIVAEANNGFYVSHISVFDDLDTVPFQFFERNDELLAQIDDHEDLQHLIRFSEGYYTVTHYNDKLVFNDLRFGQMLGWEDPTAPFVFYYYLDHSDNALLIQRGRFARWNFQSFLFFLERIAGIQKP